MSSALLYLITFLAAPTDVVARVRATAITAAEVTQRLAEPGARGRTAQSVLDDLLAEAVLAQEAARLGLGADPRVVQAADEARRRAAGDLLIARELGPMAKVTDAQLLEQYHATNDRVRFDAIILASPEQARAVIARLKAGADFAAEARVSLDATSATRGGDFGSRVRGELKEEVRRLVFSTPIGQVVGPVDAAPGWMVLRVRERTLGDEAGFAANREKLRRFFEDQLRSRMRTHLLQQLTRDVKVDEAFLRSTDTRLDATPAELERVVAKVGDRPVRYRDVLAQVGGLAQGREGGHFSGPEVKREMALLVVRNVALGAEALRRGLGRDPSVVTAVELGTRPVLAVLLAERLRAGVAAPSAAEVEAYYRERHDSLRPPWRRPCAHIAVSTKAQATELKQRIARGERFDVLAGRYSLERATAARGGSIGDLGDDTLARLAGDGETTFVAALRDAPPDQVSGPVQSTKGWHLVRCGARTSPAAPPLADIRDRLAAQILEERRTEVVRRRIVELRNAAPVSIDREALRKTSFERSGK